MKLNTLLLTSAATLMATSVAFAADLPSKKAAPSAGSVQVCKVGGMTGFQLPGSDTCMSISGRVTYDASYADTSASSAQTNENLLNGLADAADEVAGDYEDYATWAYDNNGDVYTIANPAYVQGFPVSVVPGPNSNDGKADWAQSGSYRILFDTRTNTEIGVVRGVVRLDGGSFSKAYVQFAGFTAGVKDSIADVVGTAGNLFDSGIGNNATGIDYQIAAGGLNFGLGIEGNDTARNQTKGSYGWNFRPWDAGFELQPGEEEEAANNHTNWDYTSGGATDAAVADRPDIIAHLSGTTGPVGFALVGVLHQAVDTETGFDGPSSNDGYAVIGRMNASLGGIDLRVWGAMSDGASAYTGNGVNAAGTVVSGVADYYNSGATLQGTSFGGEIGIALGSKTKVYFAARRNVHELNGVEGTDDSGLVDVDYIAPFDFEWTEDQYGVYLTHTLAKGLTLQPEYTYTTGDATFSALDGVDGSEEIGAKGDYSSSKFGIRIQRDF